MIRLSDKAQGDLVCQLTAYATGKGKKRFVPSITFTRPTTATIAASRAAAQRVIPGRDEDESDADYQARLDPVLASLGFHHLAGAADIADAVAGILEQLMLTQLARIHAKSWDGFVDHEGNPIELSPLALGKAMEDSELALHVRRTLLGSRLEAVAEGNG